MIACMLSELEIRAEHEGDTEVQTIYFGGGTPSILEEKELAGFMAQIHRLFVVRKDAEVTLEANPDDLSAKKLHALKQSGVNRLSIGVQSFFNEHLSWMNRSHNARQAIECIENAHVAGFSSINADLIYAIPGMTMAHWEENIQRFIDLQIGHWSCYNLTIEEKTVLHNWVRKGKTKPVPDREAAQQYLLLMEMARGAGMEHYEISNFCKPGQYSRHNANYWRGVPYLGIGPSAHSYDGMKRSWNLANNALYMKAIQAGNPVREEEILTLADRFNEFVLTGMRTKWGCSTGQLQAFGETYLDHFQEEVKTSLDKGWVIHENDLYKISASGKLFADRIASDLFYTEPESDN